jgi:hypothetical protein
MEPREAWNRTPISRAAEIWSSSRQSFGKTYV